MLHGMIDTRHDHTGWQTKLTLDDGREFWIDTDNPGVYGEIQVLEIDGVTYPESHEYAQWENTSVTLDPATGRINPDENTPEGIAAQMD